MASESSIAMGTEQLDFQRDLPSWAEKRLRTWERNYRIWIVINHGVGLLAIAFTAGSFFFGDQVSPGFGTQLLGGLATISVAALAIVAPLRSARGYIAAWRILDDVAIGFQSDPAVTLQDLRQAIKDGETILSSRDPY